MESKSARYELVVAKKAEGQLTNSLVCGHAFLEEGDTYYTVKLMMFPGQSYYLSKNRDSQDRYTVFSKLVHSEASVRFQNPVGSGRLSADLASYLEIYFPIFRSQIFMCLFPKNL